MKRVLHMIKGLARGGAEQLLLSQAPHLDRTRYTYEVAYLLPDHNAIVADLEKAGLPVTCLEGSAGIGWIRRLRRLVHDHEIDLIHDHSPYVAIGTRLALGGRGAPRLVYSEHNVWEAYHRATYWGNMITYPRSDHVFAVSEHVRASIRYRGPFRLLRMPEVETLYHGVDPLAVERWRSDGVREEFGIPDDAPLVCTVANFRPSKGHSILLDAAVRVREAVPGVRFLLVGLGPLESDTRRRARDLGLGESVIFTGAREDAPRLAGACDVFALASVHEGLAIALIEAMALGRPAVVTRVGGLTEVVDHGKQAFVVEPRDPEGLAEAIITLLRDEPLRHQLGEAARRRAETFDIRKAVRRHEEVYTRLLA